jgi:hypothetical protein
MIQEGLRVALKDKTLGVIAVEVQLVLQSPGVFSARDQEISATASKTTNACRIGRK